MLCSSAGISFACYASWSYECWRSDSEDRLDHACEAEIPHEESLFVSPDRSTAVHQGPQGHRGIRKAWIDVSTSLGGC